MEFAKSIDQKRQADGVVLLVSKWRQDAVFQLETKIKVNFQICVLPILNLREALARAHGFLLTALRFDDIKVKMNVKTGIQRQIL